MFKQTWWVTLAAVLAGLQAIFAIGSGLDSEIGAGEQIITLAVLGAFIVSVAFGMIERGRHRCWGDALIAIGVIPSALAGIVAFWFPPMWLLTGAGLAVMVAAVRDAFTSVRVAA